MNENENFYSTLKSRPAKSTALSRNNHWAGRVTVMSVQGWSVFGRLWWKWFVEKVCFESRVKERRGDRLWQWWCWWKRSSDMTKEVRLWGRDCEMWMTLVECFKITVYVGQMLVHFVPCCPVQLPYVKWSCWCDYLFEQINDDDDDEVGFIGRVRLVICKEEDVGGLETVTTDEDQVLLAYLLTYSFWNRRVCQLNSLTSPDAFTYVSRVIGFTMVGTRWSNLVESLPASSNVWRHSIYITGNTSHHR